ncbi:putative serine/threonine-protein kinase tsuA [Diplodia seriata]|nr:putative serine/threonine-protein kinase tsuA [Diplodia seriata]
MDDQRFYSTFRKFVPLIDKKGALTFDFDENRAKRLQKELRTFKAFEAWAECPRLFALLFMLRDGEGMAAQPVPEFKDDLLPFPNEAYLRTIDLVAEHEVKSLIHYQDSFLASSDAANSLDHFKAAGHLPLLDGNAYFELEKKQLGESKSAFIGRVTHRRSNKVFVCKRFRRTTSDCKKKVDKSPSVTELFSNEKSNLLKLKDLQHLHLITYICAYTDKKHFALIFEPVAEDDLGNLFKKISNDHKDILHSESVWNHCKDTLQHSFGCLTSGVMHLHREKIRHRDIKPGNILIHDGKVIICDFGIAHDWSDSARDFTEGPVDAQTCKYSAPEVNKEWSRDPKADMWSLGCVFLEIITVLKQGTLSELHKIFGAEQGNTKYNYCEHPELISQWIEELGKHNVFNEPLPWIAEMVRYRVVAFQ